jgi:hypothetical protein
MGDRAYSAEWRQRRQEDTVDCIYSFIASHRHRCLVFSWSQAMTVIVSAPTWYVNVYDRKLIEFHG